MSYFKDKKSTYSDKRIDNDFAALSDSKDTIDKLLINTDFNAINIPETKQYELFANDEQRIEINPLNDIHDSTILESIVKKTPVAAEAIEWTKDIQLSTLAEADSILADFNNDDEHLIIAPINTLERDKPAKSLTSLVQNDSAVKNTATPDDLNLNNFFSKNTIGQSLPESEINADSDINHRVAISVDSPATLLVSINETSLSTEWLLFKTEQDNINNQQKKRITALEKSLRRTTLFCIIASFLAGVSLIAVVSLLI